MVLKYRSVFMFSMEDSPDVNSRNPSSYISFDLTFKRFALSPEEMEDNILEVRIIQADQGKKKSVSAIAESSFCCNEETAHESNVCRAPNALVLGGISEPKEELIVVDFANDGYEDDEGYVFVEKRFTYQVEQKDLYLLMFSYCQPNDATVSITGSVSWRNPYGFLPGELYGFLPFYLHLSLVYLGCALVWGYLCAKYWKDLLVLQNCITLVIVLGMIEVNLRYFDFHSLNETGIRNHGLLMASVLFAVAKKCVSRLLVLVVSMGFGVVKPHLGEEGKRVLLLGAVYVVVATLHHLVDSLTDQVSSARFFFLLPVAIVDTIFYFWIFHSLKSTIQQLEARGQDIKLNLYLRFQRLLVLSIVVSVLWAIYYVMENFMEYDSLEWESVYFMESFWDCLYLAILIVIMFLWRPNQNSQRYAYTAVKTWDQDDDVEEYGNGLEDSVGDFELKNNTANGRKVSDSLLNDEAPEAKNE
eukprot:CAMPEP_0204855310 /NCGR_PEP_ID=MMETSP1347-20130617/16568_1 /ASSEMBLY_ACC=CAM_ASM_000690 /TAXON_ID=215587 /ORGANISM="Aplanochytrium stocchinoi, Strain GSBS06" /LENGTH=471 /DNA_ID=CAMNT_0052001367 /DNA_START=122 /DNA_END=1537 /DNA_ORIENTATION=-